MSILKKQRGFTLIELMVVVGIIAILAAVVIAALNNARTKGGDAAIKSNLKNAITQAEVFYNTNTLAPNTYSGICNIGPLVGGATTIGPFLTAAATAAGLAGYNKNPAGGGTGTTATCNVSGAFDAWAAEVPLAGSTLGVPKMWCIDSLSHAKQESVNLAAAVYVCS